MSNWNRSDVIALSGLIVSIVAIIIGVSIPEVRCFFGLDSESCPSSQTSPISPNEPTLDNEQSKPSPPTTTVESGINLISTATGVDYTLLRDYLAVGRWKEADQETSIAMLQAAGVKERMWLSKEEFFIFPCEDLRIIDQLWVEFSQGKFGFSVQKEIWQRNGRPTVDSYQKLAKLYIELGWKTEESGMDMGHGYLRYDYLGGFVDMKSSRVGNLPSGGNDEVWFYDSISSLAQRVVICTDFSR